MSAGHASPCRSILVTVPTLTSPTRTREFGWMLFDVGHLRLDGERARAAALGAGQRQRVQPAPSATRTRGEHHDQRPTSLDAQPEASSRPPPGGSHHAGQPAAGSVGCAGPRRQRPIERHGASAGNGAGMSAARC